MIFKYLIILIIGLANAQDLPSLEEITNPTKSISSSTTSSTTTSTTSTTSSLNQDIENLLPEGFSFNLTQFTPGQFCECDILEGACDVNCCCDEDCTDQDILAFSKCHDTHVQSYDPRFCFSTEMVVKNNTKYSVEQVNDNLFCIVNDNLNRQGFTYLDRAPILNVSDFEHMKSRHMAFNWHSTKDKTSTPIMTNESYYRSGDPILTITNLMEFSHLSLPQSINGRQCNAFSPIKYLSQEERSCQVYLKPESDCTNIPELNAKNFLSGFKVIANQALLANLSKDDLVKDIPELLVVPKPEVCINFNRQDRVCVDLVLNEALSEPTENCENILTELRLEIVHAGTLGIQSIKALLELTNYSALRSQAKKPILINQKFSYVHYWTNENITIVPELKSGNPGYLQGYPIRAGVLKLKDPQMVKDESTIATMTENDLFIDRGEDDFTKYLSIMTNSQDCNAVNRQRILFGINTRVGCIMSKTRKQLSESCMDIRKKAMDVLVGTYPNEAKAKRNKRDQLPSFGMALLKRHRVGIFGNSQSTNPQDWIEVLIENLPDEDFFEALQTNANGQCRDVISHLHIQIYFANVGAQANPQAKIIGVHYNFGSPEDINFQCLGLHCRLANATQIIEISTSVSFVDMTQPALPQFKEKPVLEAKLPHDFFYPFVKSYSLSKASLPKMSICMFVFVLKCLIFQ